MNPVKSFFCNLLNLKCKDKAPPYPRDYLEIDWSGPAKREGVRDNLNKIINHYYIDKLGFRQVKTYFYNESILYSLKKVRELPVIDKTKKEEEFHVFEKVNLSEIEN